MTQDVNNRGQEPRNEMEQEGALQFDPGRTWVPMWVIKATIGSMLFLGSLVGAVHWRLGQMDTQQERQEVKLDMMIELWRNTEDDVKERATKHEVETLRQEMLRARKE